MLLLIIHREKKCRIRFNLIQDSELWDTDLCKSNNSKRSWNNWRLQLFCSKKAPTSPQIKGSKSQRTEFSRLHNTATSIFWLIGLFVCLICHLRFHITFRTVFSWVNLGLKVFCVGEPLDDFGLEHIILRGFKGY